VVEEDKKDANITETTPSFKPGEEKRLRLGDVIELVLDK
jgi:hypothetical protein